MSIQMEGTFSFGSLEQRVTFRVPIELRAAYERAGFRKYSDQMQSAADPVVQVLGYLADLHDFSKNPNRNFQKEEFERASKAGVQQKDDTKEHSDRETPRKRGRPGRSNSVRNSERKLEGSAPGEAAAQPPTKKEVTPQ